MVIQSIHGDAAVEVEEAIMANPGEVQVGVEDNRHEHVCTSKQQGGGRTCTP